MVYGRPPCRFRQHHHTATYAQVLGKNSALTNEEKNAFEAIQGKMLPQKPKLKSYDITKPSAQSADGVFTPILSPLTFEKNWMTTRHQFWMHARNRLLKFLIRTTNQ